MRQIRKHLEKLRKIERKRYHPLIHKIHKKHKISKKTLFYVKEYGAHTNVPRTIIKESIKVLIFASIISSLGGFAIEHIKTVFVSIVPLVVLLPAFNDMLGDYGSIISSRFSTMLYEGRIKGHWSRHYELRKLLVQVMIIALITGIFCSAVALGVSYLSNYAINAEIAAKIFVVAIVDVVALVTILFFIAVFAGLHFYRKKEDPNNFLIPITTSVADFGNMIILAALVILIF